MEKVNVFLGGTCAESTWRNELMPMLDNYNITYFNPVVDDWNESCQIVEDWHKENADFNLFVITKEMEGVFSIAEVVDLSNKKPDSTIFCVLPEGFSKGQLKSLSATAKLIKKNGATITDNLNDIAVILNERINEENGKIFSYEITKEFVTEVRPDTDDTISRNPTIFLAGTIDMGNSEDWQKKTIYKLHENEVNCTVYNPRRIAAPEDIEAQINWEQDHLNKSDIIFMYIAGSSKSPITLLELGQFINSKKLLVVCESDFYRYDNVKVMCERYRVPLYNTYEKGLDRLVHLFKTKGTEYYYDN